TNDDLLKKFDLSSSSEKASIIMESLKRCPSDALDMLQKFLNEDREGDEGDELVGEEENDENVLPFREEIRNELNDAKKEYRKVPVSYQFRYH
ncbi:16874_t:CDS:2, partial [Entrophospora sp. SA101]